MAVVVYGSGWAFQSWLERVLGKGPSEPVDPEDPAVEDPAVEDPAVEDPAVDDPGPLTATTRWILGLAWWTVGLFVLASVGLFSGLGLGAWLLLTCLLGAAAQHHAAPTQSPPSPSPSTAQPDRLGVWLPWLAVLLAVTPMLLIALGPTRSWDAEVYHLSIPKLYVENGGFRNVEMSVYSHWPLGTELLFAGALILQDFITAKLVHFGFGLLLLWAFFESFRARRLAALTAVFLFLANDVVLFEMRSAYVDLAVAFYALAAFLFLARAADADSRTDTHCSLALAGVAAALLASTKITGIVTAGLLAVVFLPRLMTEVRRSGIVVGFRPVVLLYALPAGAGLLPWCVKSAVMTGNPVYPLLWSTFGGPDWSPRLAQRFAEWQQSIGMGREPIDYLLLLPRLILFGDHGYGTFDGKVGVFWILLLPLVILLWWRFRPDRHTARGLTSAGLLFLFWAASSQQMRFLIPALALICWVVGRWVERVPIKLRWVVPVLSAMLLLRATDYPRLAKTSLRYAQIFASGTFDPAQAEPAVSRVVDQLPADAKILLLQTNHRFALSREVLADSFFEASQISDWLQGAANKQEIDALLRDRGVTHVLLRLAPPRAAYPELLLQWLQDPAYARPIHRDERHLLLEVQPQAP